MPSASQKAKAASTKSESQIENEILVYLARIKGGFFWKNTSGGFFDGKAFRRHASPFAIRGTSDILGIYAGRFVCFEVKSAKGRPSVEQLLFIQKVQSVGGVGAVVNSVEKVRECFLEWFDVYVE